MIEQSTLQIFVAFLMVFALCVLGRPIWNVFYSIYLYFFDCEYIFGNNYSRVVNPPKRRMPLVETKCCSLHEYEFLDTLKHKWTVGSNGQPLGYRTKLDDAIRRKKEKPGHTETELEVLLNWKKAGNDIVFTSWNRWQCKKCGDIKATEFYALANRSDREFTNLIIDLNDKKKRTQPLPIDITRREIPVEPMKRY